MRTLLLVLAIGCIFGCAGWLLFGRWDGETPGGREAAGVQPGAPTQVSIADPLSMPLFSIPQAAVPPVSQAGPRTDLRLIGISFTPRRRAAFFSSGGQTFWLAEGQARDGIRVTRLERSAVEIQGVGEVQRLELFKTPRPSAQAAPPEVGQPGSRAREPASAPSPSPAPPNPESDLASPPGSARK